jgi:hypothetical protein
MFELVEITCFTEVVFNDGKAFRIAFDSSNVFGHTLCAVVPLTVFQRTF